MNWWKTIKAAATPPSYVQERKSDLIHVCELLNKSPRESKKVLLVVIEKLKEQNNSVYANSLSEAYAVIIDSPKKAFDIIKNVIDVMDAEKEEYEQELERKRWMARYE
jgi:hypothetical protein